MVQLSSEISGVSLWAYDQTRLTDGQSAYASATGVDGINPVTQTPTKNTNTTQYNYVRYVCDVNHHMNGLNIMVNYFKWSTSEPDSQAVGINKYYSTKSYSPIMFCGENAYISETIDATSGTLANPTESDNKDPYTTDTKGIKIIDQTGMVPSSRGSSVVIFEVQPGYKIPVGNKATVLPKIPGNFGIAMNGTKYEFPVKFEIKPGQYEMVITEPNNEQWLNGTKIDFSTVVDTSTLPHSKITWQLSHCTVTPNETNVTNGVHSWTFTAENGYVFDHTGGIFNPNTAETGDEIPATNTSTTNLNNYDVTGDMTVSLTAYQQKATTISIKQNLTNVRSNITSNEIGRKLNAIQLTADSGYNFQSAIQLLFYAGDKVVSEYNVNGNNQSDITIPLNTVTDNTITDNMTNIVLTAAATKKESQPGYEHNYLITDTELSSFSNDHIWNYVGGQQGEEIYNVSQYIDNLIELPFKVDTTTTVNPISVGKLQTKTVSHETKTRLVMVDLGKITVPAKYNNGYDYQDKSIKLYLPFVPPITINNENAIEKTIHISYTVDISNGNLTINLDNDGVLFYTETTNISSQLPFLNTLKNTIIKNDTHFNDNHIRQPYLVVSRETPILDNDYYPTIERGMLSNYNGNVKATQLNNLEIPDNEQEQVNELLQKGVKINAKSN